MSTKYAKPESKRVVFIIYPGVTLLDVTGPAQVFSSANSEISNRELSHSESGYDIVIASTRGGLIVTDTGLKIDTEAISELPDQPIDTIVVAGGGGVFEASEQGDIVAWLRQHMNKARRTVSTCMGVFLTAETGLLGNRNVTTHWRWCDELQQQYPELNVVPEPIFIKEGNYASSAGVTSGIDLALSLVEDDYGRGLALAIAKNLVLYLKRVGGQSQFSSLLLSQTSEPSNRFGKLNDWISDHLGSDLNNEVLAKKVGMSERSFSRQYATHVGQTPAKAVEIFRFEKAKRLLETTNTSVKVVSTNCGFNDYERMRRTFVRQIGVSPMEYRQRFGR